MKNKIQHVHFQITRNCNLRCEFCGQWGKKGFFAGASGEEMVFSDWEKVIAEIQAIRDKSGISPLITVWGGEPLVSPIFDDIMILLKKKCFETEVITNGVMMDKHFEVLRNCTNTLYVSIDGPMEIHDKLRGKGIYKKVVENIKKIDHKKITVMSVITESLIAVLPEFLDELNKLNIHKLFLQDMIGLTSEEVKAYKEWLKIDFNINATNIDAWNTDTCIDLSAELKNVLDECEIDKLNYAIVQKKHTSNKNIICKSPFSHLHIAWNGEVLYCTDHYDFTAGNVKEESLESIFMNEKSKKFREGILNNKCPACDHCSWRVS